ncbi:MAG: hypothetical protein HWD58_00265 [Bacteroidota bacterium]|nr:MAG: hypothetical protein HWD58_00265 [Bacteroidota bacterium]
MVGPWVSFRVKTKATTINTFITPCGILRLRIDIRTPSKGASFQFGDDVNVIGTVTDLEVTGKSGKLQSLSIEIVQYDPAKDTIIKTLMKRTPDVDGLAGFTMLEKYSTPAWGAATIYCRLHVVATDYSTRVGRDSLLFTVSP